MGIWSHAIVRYAAYGALFGTLFPIGATLVDIWLRGLPFSLESITRIQQAQPLHWVIDTAPLFLGLFAGFAGYRQAQIERALLVLNEHAQTLEVALQRAERAEELARLNQENARLYAETRRQLEALEQLAIERDRHLETIRQLATPLIPIADNMLVLPLIGALDCDSAERLRNDAIRRVAATSARVLIIDMTGVAEVTDSAIPVIIGFFTALALLGTQAIVTGIRPLLAQQLVAHNPAFSLPRVAATLAQGVALAQGLRRSP